MTRAQFVEKWTGRLTVLGLYGLALDSQFRVKGVLTANEAALTMPKNVDAMIAEMLSDMNAVAAAKKEAPK